MKITKKELAERTNLNEAKIYRIRNNNPRLYEVLIKGVIAETVLPFDYFERFDIKELKNDTTRDD
jgi:uncharacterized membrane protein